MSCASRITHATWSAQPHLHVAHQGDTCPCPRCPCCPQLALQRELGLPEDPDIPLLGFIGRLDYQKGVDLIRDAYDWMMGERVQLVLLGSGRDDLESSLKEMEAR